MKLFVVNLFLVLTLLCTACAEPVADVNGAVEEAGGAQPTDSQPKSSRKPKAPSVEDRLKALELPQDTLTIGSKAPKLEIEHWLSDNQGAFPHITEFEPGKVYVVEFWATWCGPCIASMPHLAELQAKHADTVQIVSVSDEDLVTVQGFLQRPVQSPGADGKTYGELTSTYCLTTDPDKSTDTAYMQAAMRMGIPQCFLVGKTGLIEWVGHPMELDEPLAKVLDGSWDSTAAADKLLSSQKFVQVFKEQLVPSLESGDKEKIRAALAATSKYAKEAQDVLQLLQLKLQLGDVKGALADLEGLVAGEDEEIKEYATKVLANLREQLKAAGFSESGDPPAQDSDAAEQTEEGVEKEAE